MGVEGAMATCDHLLCNHDSYTRISSNVITARERGPRTVLQRKECSDTPRDAGQLGAGLGGGSAGAPPQGVACMLRPLPRPRPGTKELLWGLGVLGLAP